ncbi:unnamed protein product [Didymodactylos carnosus]|uniref:AI-2E family transporter n=1 Tax=Didymodactylos carnosus TaxID=1234261 RepID=A0A814KSP1_9BILA|nr:unnamed protein product [Didymodactylos carnosus]CAF1270119.1 unnamed protein product [Didymodactylos carnosus]CAF3824600.1 unnamed protein product [Didymodactylos carnosus]CAF4075737.1 unnamed protein product [Didymodactylos carnosus]
MTNNKKDLFPTKMNDLVTSASRDFSTIDETKLSLISGGQICYSFQNQKLLDGRANLMKWCALALSLLTLFITYRYVSIVVLAVWFASICRPLMEYLVKYLPLKKRTSKETRSQAIAATIIIVIVLCVIIPIIVLIVALSNSALNLIARLAQSSTVRNAINFIVVPLTSNSTSTSDLFDFSSTNTTSFIQRLLAQQELTDAVKSFGGKALSVLSLVANATAQFVIGILIFLIATYTFLVDGPELWQWMINHSPLSAKHMNRLKKAFDETGRGLLIGVGLTCLVQGIVAAIAYLCLRIPRALVLGLLTGFCSLIPIIGTAIVWIPITIGFIFQTQYIKAGIMIVVGVLVIGSIDNLLRPLFSKLGAFEMSTLLLLLSIFGGIEMLGPWGALLGPVIVRLATEALILVREDQEEPEQQENN